MSKTFTLSQRTSFLSSKNSINSTPEFTPSNESLSRILEFASTYRTIKISLSKSIDLILN
jgi:hypothetical protein